jgi:hypothetical protein
VPIPEGDSGAFDEAEQSNLSRIVELSRPLKAQDANVGARAGGNHVVLRQQVDALHGFHPCAAAVEILRDAGAGHLGGEGDAAVIVENWIAANRRGTKRAECHAIGEVWRLLARERDGANDAVASADRYLRSRE